VRIARWIVAVLLALAGLVWLGQGLGFIPGSFMTGSTTWAVIGAACLVVAAVIAARELRRGAPPA
jgi:hypothetical protein